MLLNRLKWRFLVLRKHKKILLCVLTVALFATVWYFLQQEDYVPVIIVEEHHEALPYWIEAAEEERIPFSENTLIHIDAHSDDALPEYVPPLPLFYWPEEEIQIDALLQRNDVFIMEAVMIGLVDRFIWIVPTWNDETKDVIHSVDDLELGWATLKAQSDSSNEFEPYLCRCEKDENGVKDCLYYNYSKMGTAKKGDGPEIKLHSTLCTNTKVYTSEVLTAKTALNILKDEEGWIEDEESIILNIDEDYFGVELPGKALTDAGISWSNVELIDDKLAAIFCPQDIDHESLGQEIMQDVLEYYIELCKFENPQVVYCKLPKKTIATKIHKDVLLNWWLKKPDFFCIRNDNELQLAVSEFINALDSITNTQLSAISRVGFCLNISPKTFAFPAMGHIVICHGTNNPEAPFVQQYKSDTVELHRDMFHVQAFLQELPRPEVVTICRSSRDGYTPRDQVPIIELNLVRHFMKQNLDNPDLIPYKVIYDEDIMITKIF